MKNVEEVELSEKVEKLQREVIKTRQQLNLIIEMLSFVWKNQYGRPTESNEKARKQINSFVKRETEKIEVLDL